ncbi:hypothetical protein AC578_7339 [Pseudocercospora eumusae]|uniref:Uncharacterized protein n=1 Tax=Pseudocercospora eumusae TaxID=321146 RepID=A0A139HX29_9PEZI|nr:hypothetical protein AC578_7339 [Pseudocercospora eumusae]
MVVRRRLLGDCRRKLRSALMQQFQPDSIPTSFQRELEDLKSELAKKVEHKGTTLSVTSAPPVSISQSRASTTCYLAAGRAASSPTFSMDTSTGRAIREPYSPASEPFSRLGASTANIVANPVEKPIESANEVEAAPQNDMNQSRPELVELAQSRFENADNSMPSQMSWKLLGRRQ